MNQLTDNSHLYDTDEELFPCVGETVLIPGPCGNIEALTSCPDNESSNAVCIICHPHPLYGGTMQNKVVHYIAKTMGQMGLRTVRFNFRGVGKSEGSYDEGVGETEDLLAIIDWVKGRSADYEIWLAGFSFGAYTALAAATRVDPAQLITVAPPVNILDFTILDKPSCPWLLIQGAEDEVVPSNKVLNWAQKIEGIDIVSLDGIDHFFHGKLNVLNSVLLKHFSKTE